MKTPKPLDLERCFEWAECQDSLSRKDMLLQLKEDIETELKSACSFFMDAKADPFLDDNPEAFLNVLEDFWKAWGNHMSKEEKKFLEALQKKVRMPESANVSAEISKFNDWVFEITFREVMEAEK